MPSKFIQSLSSSILLASRLVKPALCARLRVSSTIRDSRSTV